MTSPAASITCPSPFGPLRLIARGGVLAELRWSAAEDAGLADGAGQEAALLQAAAAQLAAYFDRRLVAFDLPMDWGQGLQARVRRAMAAIPMGQTRSYGQIAATVGAPAQAVGQACGANPLPILIPCHRVTGAGWFGGFSAPGGVETKAALLRHEGALLL